MAGFDAEMLQLILSTLRKYADKRLVLDYLLALDHKNELPREVPKEPYDLNTLGLHLLFIPDHRHTKRYRGPARLVARVG